MKLDPRRINLDSIVNDYDPVKDDEGPWRVDIWKTEGESRVVLQSDDFAHDVALEVTGDFACFEQRVEYAHKLAARMNQMSGVRPLNWRHHRG